MMCLGGRGTLQVRAINENPFFVCFVLFYSKGCGYASVNMYSPNLLHLALEYSLHISDYRLVIGTCISHKHLKLTMFMIALIRLSSKASSPLCLVSSNISGKTKLIGWISGIHAQFCPPPSPIFVIRLSLLYVTFICFFLLQNILNAGLFTSFLNSIVCLLCSSSNPLPPILFFF